MVTFEENTGTYVCDRCKLHYTNKTLAEQCEAWDAAHDSCNLAIAQQSEESKSRRAVQA
jgi:hypothetical protein